MTETPNPNIPDTDTLTGDIHPIRRAVIALGSNLGEREANLQGAVDSLADTPEVWVVEVSSVYETSPVGGPDGAGDFLNAVVIAETSLSAHTLLDRALAIEDAYSRERSETIGAPRTLDVDLIVLGDRVCDDDRLTLPHPRAAGRRFVLLPWHDLEPDGEIPGHGRVADLLGKTEGQGVERRDDIHLAVGG